MSSFSKLVKSRFSCRRYDARPVPREIIDQCIDTARMAPSACNSQPWRFLIIDDPLKRDQVVHHTLSGIYRSNAFVQQAPVIIVVERLKSSYTARLGGMIRDVSYSLIDIGIACDHLTLRASELGLGTCWLGWFHEAKLKKILGMKKRQQVDIMLSLGYPLPPPSTGKKKRRGLDEVRTYL